MTLESRVSGMMEPKEQKGRGETRTNYTRQNVDDRRQMRETDE